MLINVLVNVLVTQKVEIVNCITKKAVRIIAKAEFRAHTTPIFKKYSLLKIIDICQFQIAFFMFKFTISKLPSMFNSYFTYTSSIHHYSTRSSISGFAMPSVRTKIRQKSIKYQGPFVWNKLSAEIKNSPSVSTFKNKLKQYLLDNC